MKNIELEQLRDLGKILREFLKESKTGDRKVFLDSEKLNEVNGICEELFMTNLGDAILVHYGADGDWTKSLFIPNGKFEIEEEEGFYGPVDEALEWFFQD